MVEKRGGEPVDKGSPVQDQEDVADAGGGYRPDLFPLPIYDWLKCLLFKFLLEFF